MMMLRSLRRLLGDSRGNIAVSMGVLVIPIFLAAGMAIDVGRVFAVKSRLSAALDAAALAAAGTIASQAEMTAVADKYFQANYPAGRIGTPGGISVDITYDTVVITATATVDMTLMRVIGVNELNVVERSEVVRTINGLELAMVLDTTSSMNSANKIYGLRHASALLVDIMFGTQATNPMLKMAVVPYVSTVNVGSLGPNIVKPATAHDPSNPLGWKGCVIERPQPYTMADLPPDTSMDDSWWKVFKYEPSLDNDYDPADPSTVITVSWSEGSTGPNLGCGEPILPLTSTKSTVRDKVANITTWARGGTLSEIGLAWGRRVLSPEAPFTEGVAWGTENWTKAIVIMTDGENRIDKQSWIDGPNEPDASQNSDLSGYGKLDDYGLVGTTDPYSPTTKINTMARFDALCTEIKAQGILIFAVTFGSGADSTTQNHFKNCATDSSKYFHSPDNASLELAFRAIAMDLSVLRLKR